VLNVVGFAEKLEDAIKRAYSRVDLIDFENKYYRTDIGQKGLKSSK
jgi:phosphoribosylamine--glycine ligase